MTTQHATYTPGDVEQAFGRAAADIQSAIGDMTWPSAWQEIESARHAEDVGPLADAISRTIEHAALSGPLTIEQISQLVTACADGRVEGEPDTGLRDAVNLLANAGLSYLDGSANDLDEVAAGSYSEDLDTILNWIGG